MPHAVAHGRVSRAGTHGRNCDRSHRTV